MLLAVSGPGPVTLGWLPCRFADPPADRGRRPCV